MNRLLLGFSLLLYFATSLLPSSAFAQGPATGTPAFGSFSGGPETINNANLNVHIAIPVLHKPGRGLPFTYDLSYDSSIWYQSTVSGTNTWTPVQNWGWRGQTEAEVGYVSYKAHIHRCPVLGDGNYTIYDTYVYHDSFGISHAYLSSAEFDCNGLFTGFTETTADGSGYVINVTDVGSETITSSAGKFINPAGSSGGNGTDRNGNKITVDGSGHFYDTLSSTSPALSVSGVAPTSTTFSYTPPSGTGSVAVTMSYVYYTVATNFAVSGVHEAGATAVYLVDKVTLPDGTFYQFNYEQTPSTPSSGACTPITGTFSTYCVTARIAKVTLPAGGYISYSYSGGGGTNNSGIFSDGSAATINRAVNDGTTSNTWIYARTQNSGAASTTLVTDPASNQAKIQFQGIYETERQSYQGSTTSGTLLSTVDTCYNGATIPCTGTGVALPISSRAVQTTLPSSGSVTLVGKSVAMYNSVGGLTESDNYAFGSGAIGGLVNKTLVTYASLPPNITAFRQQITVQNGAGTAIAQTNYNYDETTPTSAPSGTPQLVSVTGSRGNLTSVQRCNNLASCSSSPKSIMTYDTAGQLLTAKDPIGNQTNFSYTDNYFDDNGNNPPAGHSALGYPTDAFVTTITPPLSAAGTQQLGYYFYNGAQAVSTEQNGNSSFVHFDSFGRPSSSYGPSLPIAGGSSNARPWTSIQYTSLTQVDTFTDINDSSLTPLSSCPVANSCRQDRLNVDGLGRPISQQLVSDPEGATSVDTTYDVRGLVKTVSHAHRSTTSTTDGIETPTYDAASRTIAVQHQDGTSSHTYFGPAVAGTGLGGVTTQNCAPGIYGYGFPTLAIDESGRKREVWTDGLGRTIEGDEPDGSGNLTSYVCYSYDPLGNLLQVVRSGTPAQTRTYAYDALSRVTSVTIPERADSSVTNHCPITFTYDSNSNLKTKTIPAPNQNTSCTGAVTITYSYDALNRPTSKTYSDNSPTIYYGYDHTAISTCPTSTTPPTLADSNPKGRMTAMCDSSGATSWAHDAAGRVITEKRIILGVPETISYSYNLDGSIASITYPSTKTVTYSVTNAQRLYTAKDTVSGTQFALMASYAPIAALQSTVTGQVSGGFSGLNECHSYNNSLEYASTKATSNACSSPSTGTAMDLSLSYNLLNGGSNGDNGSVTTIANNADPGRNQTLQYDPLNRISSALSQATTGNDCWGQTFSPDPLANLSIANAQCSSWGLPNMLVDANNHISTDSTFGYDSVGNMTKDGQSGVTYSFDDENRLYKATGVNGGPWCYVYDGNGLRVAKIQGGTGSSCTGGTVTKLYWRSLSGDSLAETDSSGNTTNAAYSEYVFFNGRRIVSRTGTGAQFYYFADQLGSTRTITTGNGPGQTPGQLCYDQDYTPYGQEVFLTTQMSRLQTTACPPNYRFTGYEYDPETGLDYAFARYYSPRLGRFLSTDPLAGAISDLQSHNAYAYTHNNPLNLIDPSGAVDCHPEELCWVLGGGNFWDGTTYVGIGGGSNGVARGSSFTISIEFVASISFMQFAVDLNGDIAYEFLRDLTFHTFDDQTVNFGSLLGRGGSGSMNIGAILKAIYCYAVPSGDVTSAGGSLGTIGGGTGSFDYVTNYTNGKVSIFRTGGEFAGFNSEWTGYVSTGLIHGSLGPNNSNYGGKFYGASVSAGVPGAFGQISPGGMYINGISAGGGLPFGRFNATVNSTNSIPMTSSSSLPPSNPMMYAIFHVLRVPCKP